jgi:3-oxoacyl-[acyl-carrier-protein] synthase-3
MCGRFALTATPDQTFPASATKVQTALGINDCVAFDVAAVCSGFLYALQVGDSMVRSGAAKRALVIGAETFSRILDWEDRATCVLFGDGAGAVLIEPSSNGEGILDTLIRSDGSGMIHLHQKAGGSRMPPTAETVAKRLHYVHQEGAAVYKFAVAREKMPSAAARAYSVCSPGLSGWMTWKTPLMTEGEGSSENRFGPGNWKTGVVTT